MGERKREKERGRKKEGERKREKERWRQRKRCPELLFLFLKGMTGASVPFSYLVSNICCSAMKITKRFIKFMQKSFMRSTHRLTLV